MGINYHAPCSAGETGKSFYFVIERSNRQKGACENFALIIHKKKYVKPKKTLYNSNLEIISRN